MNADGPRKCDCCRYPIGDRGRHFTVVSPEGHTMAERWYCGLCAGSYASTASFYKESYGRETMFLAQTACYVGNAILAALEAGERP